MRALVLTMALMAGIVASSASAQSRSQEPAPDDQAGRSGPATLRGRVTDAATGRPVKKAHVRAVSTALRNGTSAYTDGHGVFEFRNLPSGNYTVSAWKANYVATAYGQSRPLEPGPSVAVADGPVDRIDIHLVRAAVLAGTVRNELGRPFSLGIVEAMHYQFAHGVRQLVGVGGVRVDDKGEFRIFGLAPGQYYLAASPPELEPSAPNGMTMYAPTYYPGTAAVTDARAFTVRAGQTIANLHMKMVTMRPLRVSGFVTDSRGSARGGGLIAATVRAGVGQGTYYHAEVNEDGTFSFEALPPGDYLFESLGFEDEAAMRVTVGSSDIANLRLVHVNTSTISGRAVIDPAELGTLNSTVQRTASETATIRGRVFDRATGRPLAFAVVRAVLPERNRETRATTADKNGRYELVNLRPGRYYLTATQAGYLRTGYGQTRPSQREQPLEVAAGQAVEAVDLGLPRGGVITGRIVDEYGDPVPNATVSARQLQFTRGGRSVAQVLGGSATTDDRGRFRVFELPPADYVVIAAVRPPETLTDDRTGYAITFYPGVVNLDAARRVSTRTGTTVKDVNIALIPATLASISGTVAGVDGQPVNGGSVSLRDRQRASPSSRTTRIRADGTFTMPGVAPGEYVLFASMPERVQTVPQAIAAVHVDGRNVTGVQMDFKEGSSLSGRLVVEPDGAAAIRRDRLSVLAYSVETNSQSGSAPIAGDLAFRMQVRPGHHIVGIQRPPPGWFLRSVRLKGVDVTDTPIDVRDEDITDIEVELTNRSTVVSGQVTDSRAKAVKDCPVVIFARDERQWYEASRYIAQSQTDQQGRFTIRGLPAGDYYAAVVHSIDVELPDPELLARIRNRAVTLSLGTDQILSLMLRR